MSLYLGLKDQLLKLILEGAYSSGSVLPTENELCETYELSRVTVRKALDELKKDGLVASVQGQGTIVSHRKGGYRSSLDLIALVAAVHNPFFASFMEHFERAAEENGSLVLFKQDFKGKALQSDELCFRFIKKNIRNMVLWPTTEEIDFELLKRLRSVGMNLVFFDQNFETEVADVVSLDNHHAITSLYQEMRAVYNGRIIFIGFDGMSLPSELLRRQAFLEVSGGDSDMYRIPWGEDIERETGLLLERLQQENMLPAGIICCNGPVGLAVAKHLRKSGTERFPLSAIDFIPEMASYPMTVYQQPMKELAEKAYQRLAVQNNQGEHWQARSFQLQGSIVRLG
jgi:DNA-binding LacI/PurR family transcriptional regulator